MNKITAAIIGFAVVPVIPSVYGALVTPITSDFNALVQLPLTLFYYPIALGFTVLLGVPPFLVLHHFRLIRWWSAVVGGSVIGAVVVVLIHLTKSSPDIDSIVTSSLLGAVSGFVFWLIWALGRETPEKIK